ncbi:hypothetical protein [Peribacillus sp. NPDC096448]|uniref:hypothetical protein n=1 Tax=Peribacillus sp. NPDC096448 TaxID=3364395 RepID=UPI00380716E8
MTEQMMKRQVNPYRMDKRTGALSPVKPSRYVQYAYDKPERQFPKEQKERCQDT